MSQKDPLPKLHHPSILQLHDDVNMGQTGYTTTRILSSFSPSSSTTRPSSALGVRSPSQQVLDSTMITTANPTTTINPNTTTTINMKIGIHDKAKDTKENENNDEDEEDEDEVAKERERLESWAKEFSNQII